VPEVALRGVTTPSLRRGVVAPHLLKTVIAALPDPLEVFARLVPLLADDAARERTFEVLSAFPHRLWDEQRAADEAIAILEQVQGSADDEVAALRKHLRLDGAARTRQALWQIGNSGALVASVFGGALLSPIGLLVMIQHPWRLLMALVIGGPLAIQLYTDGDVLHFKPLAYLVIGNAVMGVAAGTTARLVLDAISGTLTSSLRRRLAVGFEAALIVSTLLTVFVSGSAIPPPAVAVLIAIAVVLGAISAAIDPFRGVGATRR
jgi:hypothetical protein